MVKCIWNISELSKNNEVFESNGYELSRFYGLVNNSFHIDCITYVQYAINILSVTNPIKEDHKEICLVSFDMGVGQPY